MNNRTQPSTTYILTKTLNYTKLHKKTLDTDAGRIAPTPLKLGLSIA